MFRRVAWSQLALVLCLALIASLPALAQDSHYRGRKYKAPPPTSHIEVQVLKDNGKPIMNAAVVFNPTMDGKDLGNLEVKTGPDGKAIIDVIPVGSSIGVQVIATGFATYAEDYLVDKSTKDISISLSRPQAQVSAYEDNDGKISTRKAGVQERVQPKPSGKPADKSAASPVPAHTSTPPESASKQ